MIDWTAICLLIVGLLVADGLARPTPYRDLRPRSAKGAVVLLVTGACLWGGVVAITGAWMPSAILVVILAGALALVSNIKRQVLGEPLVFSDLALVGAVFQHPQFYVSAIRPWQLALLSAGLAALAAVLLFFSTADHAARFAGLLLAAALACLVKLTNWSSWWRLSAKAPDLDRDVRDHGLIATLIAYWQLWLRQPGPGICDLPTVCAAEDQLLVIVQCESFADPAALFGDDALALPGLDRARRLAWQQGQLQVSGFGAYTMRTEFGALFGISEERLGFHRYDPFLTGSSAASWALPNRLGDGWKRVFIHPHDMRFYGRDRLMPAAGFDALIGEEAFPPPTPDDGPYVTDAAVCDKLLEIGAASQGRCLLYAVTIENHGPWSANGAGSEGNKAEYLRFLQRSDAMLSRLIEELPQLGRPVTLCFFGDHRPSIPQLSTPGGERHTPFVIVKFDREGQPVFSPEQLSELTPAQLHAEILAAIRSGGRQ